MLWKKIKLNIQKQIARKELNKLSETTEEIQALVNQCKQLVLIDISMIFLNQNAKYKNKDLTYIDIHTSGDSVPYRINNLGFRGKDRKSVV